MSAFLTPPTPATSGGTDHGTSALRWGTSWVQTLNAAVNANATTALATLNNTSTGASANAKLALGADIGGIEVGINGSGYSGTGTYGVATEAFVRGNSSTAGLYLNASSGVLRFGVADVEVGRWASDGLVAGAGDASATPGAGVLRGTKATGTNIAGSNLTITPGLSTGSGVGGSLVLQAGTTGGAGSAQNAAATRITLSPTAVTVNGVPLLPDANGTRALGSSSLYWGTGYVSSLYLTGTVGLGTTSAVSNGLQIGGGSTYRELRLQRNVDGSGGQAQTFYRSRGTEAAPTALTTNDVIGSTSYAGHDGTSYVSCAQITANVTATPSTGVVNAALFFGLQPIAGGAVTNYVKLTPAAWSPVSNGGTTNGTSSLRWSTTFTQALDVSGKAGFGGITGAAATSPIDIKTTFVGNGADNGAIRIERYNLTQAGYLENILGLGLYDGSRYTIAGQRNPDSSATCGLQMTTGVLIFSANTGLTAGTAFTPTEIWRADSGGLRATGPAATIGYGTGAGGTVTQATSKATGVTLNKGSGQITTAADALAAGATATFTFTNSLITAADQVLVQRQSGGTAGAYEVWCDSSAAGSCTICIRNRTAGSLSEAVVLNFKVIKGAAA